MAGIHKAKSFDEIAQYHQRRVAQKDLQQLLNMSSSSTAATAAASSTSSCSQRATAYDNYEMSCEVRRANQEHQNHAPFRMTEHSNGSSDSRGGGGGGSSHNSRATLKPHTVCQVCKSSALFHLIIHV